MGRSLLIEDGALPWIVQNANNEASPIRRHIELALCHLAQHGKFTLTSPTLIPTVWAALKCLNWYNRSKCKGYDYCKSAVGACSNLTGLFTR